MVYERDPTHVDTTLSAFSHYLRRTALRVLNQEEREMPLDELARHVAARNADKDVSDVTGDEAYQIRIALHHTHVPKLADARLVRYDQADETVGLTRHADRVEQYQDVISLE